MKPATAPSFIGKRVVLVSKDYAKLSILRETKDGTIFFSVKKVNEMAVAVSKHMQHIKLQDDIGFFWIDEKYLKLVD